jgi:hypothetical protein
MNERERRRKTRAAVGRGWLNSSRPQCIAYRDDGKVCGEIAEFIDEQRGGMVCEKHRPAVARANYQLVDSTPEVVLIRDIGPWDKFKTITNAAEQVVSELAPILAGRRLEYYDSSGDRAELLVRDGKFAGYAPFQKPVPLAEGNEDVCPKCGRLYRPGPKEGVCGECLAREMEGDETGPA